MPKEIQIPNGEEGLPKKSSQWNSALMRRCVNIECFAFRLILLVCAFFVFGGESWAEAPTREWIRTYRTDPAITNQSATIAWTAGGIIVGGTSQNSAEGNSDYLLLKYAPNGEKLWEARYDTNMDEEFRAMALDPEGNIIVTGTSDTAMFNAAGGLVWSAAPGGRDVAANDSAIYVTGFSEIDLSLAKLNKEGGSVWTHFVDGQFHTNDYSQKVTLDAAGNIFMAGTETFNCDLRGVCSRAVTLSSYSSSGQIRWRRIMGRGSRRTEAQALTVDSAGNILVLYNEESGPAQFGCNRFSGTGEPTFPNPSGISPDEGFGRAMALDNDRNIYLTGRNNFYQVKVSFLTTAKASVEGIFLWAKYYPEEYQGLDEAVAIGLDSSRNVFVAGHVTNSTTGLDLITISYDNNGRQLWVDTYDGPAHGHDMATALVVDPSGNVYVTGYSVTPDGGTEFVTIKYSNAPTIGKQPNGSMRVQFHATPSLPYTIQGTTNFLDWVNLITQTADTNGIVRFDDTNAPALPFRFYRGKTGP